MRKLNSFIMKLENVRIYDLSESNCMLYETGEDIPLIIMIISTVSALDSDRPNFKVT